MPRRANLLAAFGAAIAFACATTAADAACKLTKSFRVVQKDGFTVQFQKTGNKWSASTEQYGSANVSLISLEKAGFRMTVHWAHGEPGLYNFKFSPTDYGYGEVWTPDRNVTPVKFRTIDPVRICS